MYMERAGHTPFSGFSKAKIAFDRRINDARTDAGLKPIADWRVHDLRCIARSLMSRVGVTTDIAERVGPRPA
jgi:hypothetical protein